MRMTEGQTCGRATLSTRLPPFLCSTLALSSLTSRMKETAAWGTGRLKGGVVHIPLIPFV